MRISNIFLFTTVGEAIRLIDLEKRAHEHSCGEHHCGEDKHGCHGNNVQNEKQIFSKNPF